MVLVLQDHSPRGILLAQHQFQRQHQRDWQSILQAVLELLQQSLLLQALADAPMKEGKMLSPRAKQHVRQRHRAALQPLLPWLLKQPGSGCVWLLQGQLAGAGGCCPPQQRPAHLDAKAWQSLPKLVP